MTGLVDQPRLPGKLFTLDGPGGVGESTVTRLVVDALQAAGFLVHATIQPSRGSLGDVARHGTDTSRGMALACLCAADWHHQLANEILPALRASEICDRCVASSLVLQGLRLGSGVLGRHPIGAQWTEHVRKPLVRLTLCAVPTFGHLAGPVGVQPDHSEILTGLAP